MEPIKYISLFVFKSSLSLAMQDFPSDLHLDGELFGGRGKFQSTVSIVKNAGCDGWKNIKYMIFDAPHIATERFEKRIETLEKHFDENE